MSQNSRNVLFVNVSDFESKVTLLKTRAGTKSTHTVRGLNAKLLLLYDVEVASGRLIDNVYFT
jgi:hypothetical protein